MIKVILCFSNWLLWFLKLFVKLGLYMLVRLGEILGINEEI